MDADNHDLWQSDGKWWTNYPPPAGFEGEERGEYEDYDDYRRTLSPEEQAGLDSQLAEQRAADRALGEAQRRAFFGIAPDLGPAAADPPPAEAEPAPAAPARRPRRASRGAD